MMDEELVGQVRLALEHLDDPLYLETLPLARRLSAAAGAKGLSQGQALRRALRLAIAALDPAQDDAPNQVPARSYQVLYRFAITRQPMLAIAHQLGISPRQGYRDLRLATEALAQVVCDLLLETAPEGELPPERSTPRSEQVRQELEQLAETATVERVDLAAVIRDAVDKAAYLAQRKGIALELALDVAGCEVLTHRVMLGQALLNLLSHIIAVHEGPRLVVDAHVEGDQVVISCAYAHRAGPELLDPQGPYAIAQELLRTLHFACAMTEAGRAHRAVVRIPLAREHHILIVDDNRGLIALFTSYLRQLPSRVSGATSAAEALELLEHARPDIVILDVMMPERDGWEVLERLRAQGGAQRPYVIVCSIINDPQLALALGADAFLSKPVSRGQLLQAIEGAFSSAR